MSVTATIKTRKRAVDLKQILIGLAKSYGYGIVALELDKDYAQFYLDGISTRPIEISKVSGGWDVRITSLASEEDYILFARTIEAVKNATGGKVISDGDEPVENPLDFYGDDWRAQQMKTDTNTLVILSFNKLEDGRFPGIELYGPVCEFCIGKRLMDDLGITLNTDWKVASDALIERFRYSQYSRPMDIRRTTTDMQIETEDGEEPFTYYTKNDFDMISYAKLILLAYDIDQMDSAAMLHYDDFMKVVPQEWQRFDNFQYFTTQLTDNEFDDFINRARPYNLMGRNI